MYSGSLHYGFILWNLFLAWIPYQVSRYLLSYREAKPWKQYILLASWLAFFPNALYLVTDLIHLGKGGNVPLWYDAFLLFSASILGLFLACISLYKTEFFLSKYLSPQKIKIIQGGIFLLTGFGVYLGRIERWNSWDVIRNPFPLAENIMDCILHPFVHASAWMMSLISAALLSLFYNIMKTLPLRNIPQIPSIKNQVQEKDT